MKVKKVFGLIAVLVLVAIAGVGAVSAAEAVTMGTTSTYSAQTALNTVTVTASENVSYSTACAPVLRGINDTTAEKIGLAKAASNPAVDYSKKYVCSQCSYIHDGYSVAYPDDNCPYCGSSSWKYVKVADIGEPETPEVIIEKKDIKKFVCKTCAFIHEGVNAPNVCPLCNGSTWATVGVDDPKPQEEVEEETKVITNPSGYVCQICGYFQKGTNCPENCPGCHVPCEQYWSPVE